MWAQLRATSATTEESSITYKQEDSFIIYLYTELCPKQSEVQALKTKLEDKTTTATTVDDQLSWIDSLASEINENVEERINLQKALFELEDVNVCNKFELKNINDYLEGSKPS